MALVLADQGASKMLNIIFKNTWPSASKDLTLKLFTNNHVPTDSDGDGTYTVAVGGGYVDKTLSNGAGWTIGSGSIIGASYAMQTWTFTGPLTTNFTIYGYYINDADGHLWYAELLPSTFTPSTDGDILSVTPKFQLSKGTPA